MFLFGGGGGKGLPRAPGGDGRGAVEQGGLPAEARGAGKRAGGPEPVGRRRAQRDLRGGAPRVLDAPAGQRRPGGRRREGPRLQAREQKMPVPEKDDNPYWGWFKKT